MRLQEHAGTAALQFFFFSREAGLKCSRPPTSSPTASFTAENGQSGTVPPTLMGTHQQPLSAPPLRAQGRAARQKRKRWLGKRAWC